MSTPSELVQASTVIHKRFNSSAYGGHEWNLVGRITQILPWFICDAMVLETVIVKVHDDWAASPA